MPLRATRAELNLAHLAHNMNLLRSCAGAGELFCPMVKGGAYGHSAHIVTRRLIDAGAKDFGVALFEEGIQLREKLGKGFDLLVFHPCLRQEHIRAAADYELSPVLMAQKDFELLKTSSKPLQYHVKFDTGMTRLGFAAADAERVLEAARASKHRLAGVCSHLASAEDIASEEGKTLGQIEVFAGIADLFSGITNNFHILNSAALLSRKFLPPATSQRLQWGSRPGISLYGVRPDFVMTDATKGFSPDIIDLRPVLSWKTEVIHELTVRKGQAVSYDGRWVAHADGKIAVLPVGYADGFVRRWTNRGEVLIRGKKFPVVGTVCMDYTMINVTDSTIDNHVGEEVVLLGEQGGNAVTAADLAKSSETNAYEVLTRISARVPRVVTHD